MIKRTFHFTATELNPIELCGGGILHQLKVDGVYELPFEIPPTTGEHDFNKCDQCQETLSTLTIWFRELYQGKLHKATFPDCCEHHQKLKDHKKFKKSDFDIVPEMVVRKIVYSNQHILNNHASENWLKNITDYLDLIVESFGQFPNGFGGQLFLAEYFNAVIDVLQKRPEIPAEKKQTIIDYIKAYSEPRAESEESDLAILIGTYKTWLNEFPFQLNSYFGDLKKSYEKRILILNGKPQVNQFTGIAVSKLHTKSSLVSSLVQLTKDLLSKINAGEFIEKGMITDLNRHRFQLESEALRIATDELTKEFTNGELEYVELLKKWLELHKTYFREISGLINRDTPPVQATKSELLKKNLGEYGFFVLAKVKELPSPSQQNLLESIATSDLPYIIAMFDFLGFLKHLEDEHFKTKNELHKQVAKLIGSTDRAVKGNVNVLNEISQENRKKYTAHLHKETVKTDYQNLK